MEEEPKIHRALSGWAGAIGESAFPPVFVAKHMRFFEELSDFWSQTISLADFWSETISLEGGFDGFLLRNLIGGSRVLLKTLLGVKAGQNDWSETFDGWWFLVRNM